MRFSLNLSCRIFPLAIAQFIIDNEKITNRRVIANEFNKYFVSLGTNLNKTYNKIGQLTVNSIPIFADYLPNSNLSSNYLVIVHQRKFLT